MWVIHAGAQINNPGNQALFSSISYGNYSTFKSLIKHGVDLNVEDDIGQSPLMHTIISLKKGMLNKVVSGGANIDHVNKKGNSALMMSADYKRIKYANHLLSKHCNIDIINHQGDTALTLALTNGAPKLAEKLVMMGANLNPMNHEGKDALLICVELLYGKSRQEEILNIINAILIKGETSISDNSIEISMQKALSSNEHAALAMLSNFALNRSLEKLESNQSLENIATKIVRL